MSNDLHFDSVRQRALSSVSAEALMLKPVAQRRKYIPHYTERDGLYHVGFTEKVCWVEPNDFMEWCGATGASL